MKLDTRAVMSIALLLGCAAGERPDMPRPTVVRTPRDAYVAAASIEPGVLRAWEDASRRALRSGLRIAPSFRERIGFPAADPHAVAYHFTLVRGQSLHVIVAPAAGAANPFVDMYHNVARDLFRPVHWAQESPARRTFVARSSGDYVLRIQPPVGVGGIHDVTVLGNVSLQFPVAGADVSSIGGVFGDPRDEGVRAHEGVDITAPRGTPVLAVADGYVEQARNTPTGGLVIWQADAAGGLTYYYAHLDELLVQAGTYVEAGNVIGTVGN
ncbi:MAG: M23 family metallopeptidase, partial [Longimicrobiales bacterium]